MTYFFNVFKQLVVGFIFLVEYFQAEIILFTKLSEVQFNIFLQAEIYYYGCSLARSFGVWGYLLDTSQPLSQNTDLWKWGDIDILISKLAYMSIEPPLHIKFPSISGIGLIFFRDHLDVFLYLVGDGLATQTIYLSADTIQQAAIAIGAFLLHKMSSVDHSLIMLIIIIRSQSINVNGSYQRDHNIQIVKFRSKMGYWLFSTLD